MSLGLPMRRANCGMLCGVYKRRVVGRVWGAVLDCGGAALPRCDLHGRAGVAVLTIPSPGDELGAAEGRRPDAGAGVVPSIRLCSRRLASQRLRCEYLTGALS